MPEVRFRVRWPDGRAQLCYSPSTVIKAVFAAGETYSLAAFLARAEDGLRRASERVREVHGFACARSSAQLQTLRETASAYAGLPDPKVTVEGFED
jgi:uncharacterized repeat protein (TIGR04042 family)